MAYMYCLADFFNLDLWPSGREPGYRDVRDGLEDLIEAAVSVDDSAPDELAIRLYGGWHGEVPATRVLLREVTEAVLRAYPRRLGRCRLRIEIADAPVWDASLRLLNSARRVPMRSQPYQFLLPDSCPHNGSCTLRDLRIWTKGRCPDSGCAVTVGEVGWRYRQKMVDTLLAVDALIIKRDSLADTVIIASDDDDMIPVLLAVCDPAIKTVHLRRRGGADAYYAALLATKGVETRTW
jgi:uncharacterized LabA/DUF88 family protein